MLQNYKKVVKIRVMKYILPYILGSGKRYAFIFDSAPLEFEATKEPCHTKTVGRLFHQFGYGIALQPSSPFNSLFTLAILKLRKSGVLEKLQTKWIKSGSCVTHSEGK